MSATFAAVWKAARAEPITRVRAALDEASCSPHGDETDFRSSCPGHNGTNPTALHVTEGSDGRVLLHCFHGCKAGAIARALDLSERDLFPVGHRKNTKRARPRPRKRGRLEVVLEGAELVGISVKGMWILSACPYCSAPGCWIYCNEAGLLDAACSNQCSKVDVLRALETRVAIREASDGAR